MLGYRRRIEEDIRPILSMRLLKASRLSEISYDGNELAELLKFEKNLEEFDVDTPQ
jgi:hypothetical protein